MNFDWSIKAKKYKNKQRQRRHRKKQGWPRNRELEMKIRGEGCEYMRNMCTWVSLARNWDYEGEECGEQQAWEQWWQQGSSHELCSSTKVTEKHNCMCESGLRMTCSLYHQHCFGQLWRTGVRSKVRFWERLQIHSNPNQDDVFSEDKWM